LTAGDNEIHLRTTRKIVDSFRRELVDINTSILNSQCRRVMERTKMNLMQKASQLILLSVIEKKLKDLVKTEEYDQTFSHNTHTLYNNKRPIKGRINSCVY
jgi:hypothetical protein